MTHPSWTNQSRANGNNGARDHTYDCLDTPQHRGWGIHTLVLLMVRGIEQLVRVPLRTTIGEYIAGIENQVEYDKYSTRIGKSSWINWLSQTPGAAKHHWLTLPPKTMA